MEMVQTQCVACKGTGLIDGWPCPCFKAKRVYPVKAFHARSGFYFQGRPDGSVEICVDESGMGLGKFIGVTIDKDTWQSMLKEIAPGGVAHPGAGAKTSPRGGDEEIMSTELERVRQEVEECFYRGRVNDGRKELADFERLVREDERAKLIRAHYKLDNSIKGGF